MSAEKRELAVGFWKASIQTSRVLGHSADFIGNPLAGFIARSPRPFHSRSTIQSIGNSFRSEQSWIAGGGHLGFDGTFEEPNLAGMTQKQMVLEAIRELPDDASVREITDRLGFLAAIQVGLDELDRGEGIPHDEIKKRLASWLTS
jgi:predicted transcriptional regulator